MTSETLSSSKLAVRPVVTTEDHQALGRPAHAGGEVVEAEQLLEALRVFLVLLQRLDQRELLVDQRGVAARQRHEHGADLRPQLRLTGRQVDRLLVHVVDRAGQLAELLVTVHGDRGDLLGRLAGPDPGDGLGQLLVGDLERTGPHLAQRHDQGTSDEQGQQQRREQGGQDDGRVGQRSRLGLRRHSSPPCPGCRSSSRWLRPSYIANILGVAARSDALLLVARPSRVPLAALSRAMRRPVVEALRLSSAAPSTPISAASHTAPRSEACWLLLWISSCCLTSDSRPLSDWTSAWTLGSGRALRVQRRVDQQGRRAGSSR